MRTIKFRGLRADGKGWVYGDLLTDGDYRFIFMDSSGWFEMKQGIVQVIPSTVGQFTGLHDFEGTEVYEGSIIIDTLTLATYTVKFGFCKKYAFTGFYCEDESRQVALNGDYDSDTNTSIKVIGNIHEKEETK